MLGPSATRRTHLLPRNALACLLTCLAGVLASTQAHGETWLLPAGAPLVRLPPDRVACSLDAPAGWSLDAGGRSLHPAIGAEAMGQQGSVVLAPTMAECATDATTVRAIVVGRAPSVDASSVVLDLDARTVSLRGRGLGGSLLRWRSGALAGADRCTDPAAVNEVETCTFDLSALRELDPTTLSLELLPPGAPDLPDLVLVDASGRRPDPAAQPVTPARVLMAALLASGATLDLSAAQVRVPLAHASQVAGASCADATCSLEGDALVVSDVHGSDDALAVQVRLRPHAFLSRGASVDAAPVIRLPLQRCPMTVASAVAWRGVVDPRVVLRVGGACAREATPSFGTDGGGATVVQTALVGDQRYVVLQLDRLAADGVTVFLRHGATVIASARVRPAAAVANRSALETAVLGPIDFIPTNRLARVLPPAIAGAATLVPVAVEGAYDVTRAGGVDSVRGVENASGSVPLHLALRDASLPAPLDQIDLGLVIEPVARALHAADVPVPLRGAQPVVELVCGDGGGRVTAVAPGASVALPWRARGTCRLDFHRERLRGEDGTQRVRAVVTVVGADGEVRADARLDRRLVLGPAESPRTMTLPGAEDPFDRVVVRVGHAETDESDGDAGSGEVQWTVVFGTARARLYASATIPTGLFRVADPGHTGILSLNAGALFRLTRLSAEGVEFPVGLEAGVMWLGIAGDTDPTSSARGQVALVAGLGLSVPIANRAHATQTSIGLHVWLEYEVSRALGSGAGSALGLVFGPSLSIGDVGTSF